MPQHRPSRPVSRAMGFINGLAWYCGVMACWLAYIAATSRFEAPLSSWQAWVPGWTSSFVPLWMHFAPLVVLWLLMALALLLTARGIRRGAAGSYRWAFLTPAPLGVLGAVTWYHGLHYDGAGGQLGEHATALLGLVGIANFAVIFVVIGLFLQLWRTDARVWWTRPRRG